MWLAGSLVVACELLVVACLCDLAPQPGIKPGPPVLGVQSLNHWATREVPCLIFKIYISLNAIEAPYTSTFSFDPILL